MILTPRSRKHLLWAIGTNQWQYLRFFPPGLIKGVIDLGAHVGAYSLLARMLQPLAEIVAIEPDPQSYSILCANVSSLGVQTIHCALGAGRLAHMTYCGE